MATIPTPILPIIHINGDRADTLTANLKAQYIANNAAIRAMKDGAPNARNYYPVIGLFEQAVAQHHRRLQVLCDLQDEIVAELKGIRNNLNNPLTE